MDWNGVLILKKLLLILLLSIVSSASDIQIEKKIYETFFAALSKKVKPSVYIDVHIPSLELDTDKFSLVSSCQKADIVIVTKKTIDAGCEKKIIFGTRYRHLKKVYVLGAFFWQKGRPNIVFKRQQLDSKKIKLPHALQEFIE